MLAAAAFLLLACSSLFSPPSPSPDAAFATNDRRLWRRGNAGPSLQLVEATAAVLPAKGRSSIVDVDDAITRRKERKKSEQFFSLALHFSLKKNASPIAAAAAAGLGRRRRALASPLHLLLPWLFKGGLRALRGQRRRARPHGQVHDGEARRGEDFFDFRPSIKPSTSTLIVLTPFPSSCKKKKKKTGRLLRLPLLRPGRALLRGRRRGLQAPGRRRPLPQPPPARVGRQGGAGARARPRLRPLPGQEPRLVGLRPPRVLRGARCRSFGGLLVRGRGGEGQLGPEGAGAGVRAEEGGAVGRDEPCLRRRRK